MRATALRLGKVARRFEPDVAARLASAGGDHVGTTNVLQLSRLCAEILGYEGVNDCVGNERVGLADAPGDRLGLAR